MAALQAHPVFICCKTLNQILNYPAACRTAIYVVARENHARVGTTVVFYSADSILKRVELTVNITDGVNFILDTSLLLLAQSHDAKPCCAARGF